ncbi:MAG: Zn-ribbon domain-containing OB-fold protein [Thermoprotei archaeon]
MAEYKLPIKLDEKEGLPVYVDQRELTLKYEIPVGDIKPFYDGLSKGEVLAPKCRKCGNVFFPPQNDCPKCMSSEMDWIPLNRQGVLVAATMVFVKPKSFEDEPYYVVGVAKLEGGISVLASVKTSDPMSLKIGRKVNLIVTANSKGNAVYSLEPV